MKQFSSWRRAERRLADRMARQPERTWTVEQLHHAGGCTAQRTARLVIALLEAGCVEQVSDLRDVPRLDPARPYSGLDRHARFMVTGGGAPLREALRQSRAAGYLGALVFEGRPGVRAQARCRRGGRARRRMLRRADRGPFGL